MKDIVECTCGKCFGGPAGVARPRPCIEAHLARKQQEMNELAKQSLALGPLNAPKSPVLYVPKNPKGTVYFVLAPRSRAIKIGFTLGDPFTRIASLQTGNPDPLELVAALPGTREDEAAFHERFRPQRLKGEWFTDDRELRAFIDGMLAARPNMLEIERAAPLELSWDELEEISIQVLHHREIKKMIQSATTANLQRERDALDREMEEDAATRMRTRRARWVAKELADRPTSDFDDLDDDGEDIDDA